MDRPALLPSLEPLSFAASLRYIPDSSLMVQISRNWALMGDDSQSLVAWVDTIPDMQHIFSWDEYCSVSIVTLYSLMNSLPSGWPAWNDSIVMECTTIL